MLMGFPYSKDMTQIPSHHDIEVLAADIARNGTEPHRSTLVRLAQTADAVALNPGAAQVLRNTAAPEVARVRAFATIARNWSEISAATQRAAFDSAFDGLAAQWEQHQVLRHGGTLTQLWESRTKLAELRSATELHHPTAC